MTIPTRTTRLLSPKKPRAMPGDPIVRSGDLGVGRTACLRGEWPFVLEDEPETETGNGGADERSKPEQPELAERTALREEGRPGRSGRVHRGVGHRDADEMD